jgi:hypothetical protein
MPADYVSGLTIARTSDQRGHSCRKVVQKKRSKRVSTGRVRFRFRTATCCRSAKTSSEVSARRGNEDSDGNEECGDQIEHESTLVTLLHASRGPATSHHNLLIRKHDEVLATDSARSARGDFIPAHSAPSYVNNPVG